MLSRVAEMAGPLAAPLRRLLDLLHLGPRGPAQLRQGGPSPIVREINPKDTAPKADLEAQMAHLQGQLEESRLELLGQTTHLRNQIHDLEKRNAELLEKVVSLTQKERALAQKVVDTRFEGSGVAADKKRLETEVREIKRRQTSTASELEDARKAQVTAKAQIEENQRRLQTLEDELQRARRRAADASRVGEEAEKARAAAEANLEMTREKVVRLETELLRSRQASGPAAPGREPGPAEGGTEELRNLQDVVSDLQMAVRELQSVVADDPDSEDLAQAAEKDENKDNEPRNTT